MRLTEIESQESAIGIIRRAIRSDRVPHAYLFAGPGGVGKCLTARALAMALNCEQAEDDPCGECRSCRKILREIHPDVVRVTLPEKKKRIPVESIRELERRLISRPHEGRAKVAIVDPADAMTDSAANALLKTLEEPRPGAFLVLVSNRSSSLLPTVRSRCQQIRFRSLPKQTVRHILVRTGWDERDADLAASLSNGSVDSALAYLGQDLEPRIAAALGLLHGSLHPTPKKGLSVAASISGRRDEALGVLRLSTIMAEEILWRKTHPREARAGVLASRAVDDLDSLAREMSIERISRFVAEAHRAGARIENNNMNPQLAVENMLMCMRGRTDCGSMGSGFGTV